MKSSALQVVMATPADLDALAPLFDQYRQFYGESSDLQMARTFFKARLEQSDSVIFMAVLNSATIGFTQLYPSYSSVSCQRLWILNDLFVVADVRKQGAATALLTTAAEFAAETKAKGLVLETGVENDAARRLYERLGWKKDTGFYHYTLTI